LLCNANLAAPKDVKSPPPANVVAPAPAEINPLAAFFAPPPPPAPVPQPPLPPHKAKPKTHKRHVRHKHHRAKWKTLGAARAHAPRAHPSGLSNETIFLYPFQGAYAGPLFGSQSIRQPNRTVFYGSLSPLPAYSRPTDNPAPGIWGFAGYNRQLKRLVIGVEGDLGYADPSFPRGRAKSPYGTLAPVTSGFDAGLRARLGVAVSDRIMIYAAGGLSAAELTKYYPGGAYSIPYAGWTVGGGIEGFITPTLSIRTEYLLNHFPGKPIDAQTIRAGAAIKF